MSAPYIVRVKVHMGLRDCFNLIGLAYAPLIVARDNDKWQFPVQRFLPQ